MSKHTKEELALDTKAGHVSIMECGGKFERVTSSKCSVSDDFVRVDKIYEREGVPAYGLAVIVDGIAVAAIAMTGSTLRQFAEEILDQIDKDDILEAKSIAKKNAESSTDSKGK
jgi:hypothetical protein